MPQNISEEELYRLAEARVKRRGFLFNFIPYIVVNLLLLIIWRVTGGGFPWFLFPLCLWGIIVLLHYLGAFVLKPRRQMSERRKKLVVMEVMKMIKDMKPAEPRSRDNSPD